MKALTCEMCGSTNLIKDGGVFVCQSCGTKYSIEEAKKMMVEGTVDVKGTVKVDTSDELKNLYEIARRAKNTGNSDNAAKYYEMILIKDPSSWEANFYSVYFQSMGCKIAEIQTAATNLTNCLGPVMDLIKQNVTDSEEQKKAVIEVWDKITDIATMLFNATTNHYQNYNNVGSAITSNANNICEIVMLSYTLGDIMLAKFDNETYKKEIIDAYKQGLNHTKVSLSLLPAKLISVLRELGKGYALKIKKLDPNENIPRSGCLLLILIALSPVLAFLTYHIICV